MADSTAVPADTAEVKAAPPIRKKDFSVVRYVGPSSVRTISQEDWAKAGLPDQAEATWVRDHSDPEHPHAEMEVSHFSVKALEVLRRDSNFVIE